MSVKHALGRGLELGRSLLHLGILKPAARVAVKIRGERLRVPHPGRTAQPRTFLPARYRYYRTSLSGIAAQLQSVGIRRLFGGGAPRTRAVFLAFGVGLGLIDQQLEDDRRSATTCQEIQAVFRKKKHQTPLKAFTSGYKLDDYKIGTQIGKGCNAAVYEAAAPFAPHAEGSKISLVELEKDGEESNITVPIKYSSTSRYPLAVKLMWNLVAGSNSDAILGHMSQELVPAIPQALIKKQSQLLMSGHFGITPKRVTPHPNIITVYRAFTDDVPLLPGAVEEYPAALPARLYPNGLGYNRTLFLVMKHYPCTLRQYLGCCVPGDRHAVMMLLQLLEGVDHLCRQGIAHRDLKSDNILLEFDFTGCPRLVISDFGCCLAEEGLGLKLTYDSQSLNIGGNLSLMAPEIAIAIVNPGPGIEIDYSKADAWAVGAIAYEIFGQSNPFYSPTNLESYSYQEKQLPPMHADVPAHVQLVVKLLLRRKPNKRPSARVAANILHLSLWGSQVMTTVNLSSMTKIAEWLLCQSAAVLLGDCGRAVSSVETELQRGFLANLDLEELRMAAGYFLYWRL